MPFKRKIVTRQPPKRSARVIMNKRRKIAQDPAARSGRARTESANEKAAG